MSQIPQINDRPIKTLSSKEIKGLEKYKKLIHFPVPWRKLIEENSSMELSKYIILAVFEKLQRDGLIK